MIDIGTVAATAAVTGGIQTAVYFLFRRSIEVRDERIEKLEGQVNGLAEHRVTRIEHDLETARQGRARIHDAIEDRMPREECEKKHALLQAEIAAGRTALVRLEQVSARAEQALERAEAVSTQQYALARELAAVAERIKDLQK